MYEPERNQFNWDNEEMQALYKILDWAEDNNADIFLQQMWSNVKCNSYSGVQPLLSAPKSLDDFAEGISKLVERLLINKNTLVSNWCVSLMNRLEAVGGRGGVRENQMLHLPLH